MRHFRMTIVAPMLLVAAGLALISPRHALGQDWVGGDGFWSNTANWNNNSVPGITDVVFIGDAESLVKDLLIQIDQPAFVEDLRIGNGNQVTNRVLPGGDAFPVSVQAALSISGENGLNPGPSQHAALFIYPTAAPVDFTADQFSLSADSEFGLREGAVANIGSSLHISGNARLTGQGVLNFTSNFFLPSNDGIIDPQGVLTINQLGDALFDLDGANESGRLFVAGQSFGDGGPLANDHLTFNGSGLADSFSNNIFLANGRNLTMDLAEGWTIDSAGSIFFSGATDPSPATIDGAPLMLQGQVFLQADVTGRSSANFLAYTTVGETATVSLDEEALLQFTGQTTVDGGQFILQEGASFLQFNGPSTLRGGTFHTFSESTSDGSILFAGENQWDGNVTINGVARQAAPATVIGPTVINADRFDLDGLEELAGFNADWQVNSSLTINAGNIDVGDDDNNYNGTITISGGSTSRLNMNLAGGEWTMAGTLNLNNNLHFGVTRVAGSKIWLKGKLNVEGADVRVDADAAFGDGSSTNFADAESSLTMRQHSRIYADAEFVGDGMLQNAAAGHMILDDGANTSDVGLQNTGLLDIDAAVGIAAIDRFDNAATGTLAIDLAGYLLGEEFDHLQVTGEAQLDGTLAVDLLTVGMIGDGLFLPEIGDEFLILTALDGVTGQFANVLPTIGDGNVYGWEVLYHPHDVTIRLADVGSAVPEPSTLLLGGGCLLTCLFSRRRLTRPRMHVSNPMAASLKPARLTCCIATIMLLSSDRLQAEVTYRTLNLTGLPAAGTNPGVNYDAFSALSLSDSGNAVFLSLYQGPGVVPLENDRGLYLTDGVTDTLVARGDDLPPGFVGEVAYESSAFGFFYVSGGDESVVFETEITGDGVNVGNNRGVFRGSTEATELVALESGWAPAAGHGVAFADINISATNAYGQSVGSVLLGGVGVNTSNDGAVYSFGLESTNLIAREGQQVPGAGPGTTFGFLSNGDPQVSNAGQVTFIGPHSAGTGIFKYTESNGLQEVVLSGTAAPGAVMGTNFIDMDFFSVNNAGATLFRAFTDGPSGQANGLYLEDDGLQLLVDQGQTAPGTFLNPAFELFGRVAINGTGNVAFDATLVGPAVNELNDEVFYKIVDGSLEFVSRQNDLIPDATDSARFGDISAFYFNDAGQVAFYSDLQGEDIDDSNDEALFAEVDGQLRKIARKGDLFDVDPDPLTEDLREVAFLTGGVTNTAGSQDGRTSLFNSAGQLLFSLSFTDGSQGLFIAETGSSADFSADGDIDGYDFLAWQRGESPNPFSATDLAAWQSNYGNSDSALAATTLVPEPMTMWLLPIAFLIELARRRAVS